MFIHPDIDWLVRRVVVTSGVNIFAQADDAGQSKTTTNHEHRKSFSVGTGRLQATSVWTDDRTVNAASNDDIDLTDLAGSLGMSCVKSIQIENLTTTTGAYLLVGKVDSVANGFEGPFSTVAGCCQRVEPDGVWTQCTVSAAGWVVDNSHKVLRVKNVGSSAVSYRIAVVGEAG